MGEKLLFKRKPILMDFSREKVVVAALHAQAMLCIIYYDFFNGRSGWLVGLRLI